MYKPAKPYKRKIIEAIRKTWRSPYVDVEFDTYPIFRKKTAYNKYKEVDHTDGIGTKGVYHWKRGTFHAAVMDALAMNLNDLAIVRAVPYKLSNHVTMPVEDGRILRIVEAMAEECRIRKIAIVGGENSFHDNTEGLDISMTVSGFIKKPHINKCKSGDALIGFKSSGLHSNGFTAVRKVFKKKTLPEFTVPTKIYLDTILKLVEKYEVNGMMHITGGAFSKLKDILGPNLDAHIAHSKNTRPQKIFFDMYKKGLSNTAMYTTFNCGIGFVISVLKKDAEKIVKTVPGTAIIGRVVKGSGRVFVESAFNKRQVIL